LSTRGRSRGTCAPTTSAAPATATAFRRRDRCRWNRYTSKHPGSLIRTITLQTSQYFDCPRVLCRPGLCCSEHRDAANHQAETQKLHGRMSSRFYGPNKNF
jgi:hypothetical protein